MPDQEPTTASRPPRQRAGRSPSVWIWILSAVVAIAGMVIVYRLVEPAPPQTVRIAAGARDGNYYRTAEAYREVFSQNGIELEILETAGSQENYSLLLDGKADLAIVQGGTLPEGEDEPTTRQEVASVAAVYLEPLFIFYRDELGEMDEIRQLRGKRIAIGPEESGTSRLAATLLRANEAVGEGEAPGPLAGSDSNAGGMYYLSVDRTADALLAGDVDVAMFVTSPDAPLVRTLIAQPQVRLLGLRRAETLARRLSYLKPVTLTEGVIDLAANLPRRDTPMIAPAAVLVTRQETHGAIVLLAAMAAEQVHRDGTYLSAPGDFPTEQYTELPVSETAAHHFQSGPSFLRRTLPFWLGSFVERMLIVLVPLLVFLVPLIRIAPPLYQWQVRSRIYRWYDQLREIDVAAGGSDPDRPELIRRLNALETEARDVSVPLSYMDELYRLRDHIDLLRRQIEQDQPRAGATPQTRGA